VAEEAKALVLDLQTVATQSVRKATASMGAERQAQFSVTLLQPEGPARPIGIRQLKTHEFWDTTAGRAVMVYGGELSTEVLVVDMFMPPIDTPLAIDVPDMLFELVDEAAWTREVAKYMHCTSVIIRENMVVV
jgi:hypothetical protein